MMQHEEHGEIELAAANSISAVSTNWGPPSWNQYDDFIPKREPVLGGPP